MLRSIAKLLKALNSESDPAQISLALCFAMVAGFTPLLSLHNLAVFFLVLVLRVNLSAFLLGLGFFSGLAYGLDPLFDRVGLAILTAKPLAGVWTALYGLTLFRIERFNNSILMGSLVCSVLLFLPLFFAFRVLIVKYREYLLAWVRKTRVMKVFQATKLYRLYQSVSAWGGGT